MRKTNHLYKVSIVLIVWAFLIGIVTLSCSDQEHVAQRTGSMSENLFYYHDIRTNLCFAELGDSLTNVECNKEVLDSAFKFESKKPSWK